MISSEKLVLTPIEGANPNQDVYLLQGPVTLSNLLTIQEAFQSRGPVLILDLAGVPYVDSAGVGAIVQAVVSRKKQGRRLVLTAPNETVRKLFHLTQVDSLLETYPTLAEVK